ncbi:MAG: hypothetical protein WCC92_14040 [Candidatus Korobacteraceae bacterium]
MIKINDVQSRIQATDPQKLPDPHMEEIVRACVRAVKADLAREKRMGQERALSDSISSGRK